MPHWPVGSCGTGYVLATHQLLGCPSLQNVLNGHSLEFVHTWWHEGPLPDPSSMHSLPAGQRDETHAGGPSPLLEQPTGGKSSKARAAATADP